MKLSKNNFLNFFLFVIYISLFLQIIFPINSLLFLNKFSQHESYVITGIKYSNQRGLSSYGMFPVGYVYNNSELSGFSIENNIYKATDELNSTYYLSGKLPKDVSQITYSKSSGVVTRFIPFLISKTNIFKINMYDYIKIFYLTLSFLSFFVITKKINRSNNFLSSFLFIILNVFNSFFITSIYSLTNGYFYFSFPLFVLSSDKLRHRILYKNDYLTTFLIFFIGLLAGRTQGYLPYFIFIMGFILFDNKIFNIKNDRKFLIKNGGIFLCAYLATELITLLQKIFILKVTLFEYYYEFLSSLEKYNLFNNSNQPIESCALGGLRNFLSEFLNIKMLDLIIIEIDLWVLIVFSIFIFLISKQNTGRYFIYLSISFLLFNLIWFTLVKGAFLCHLHVYPSFLLFSYIPIFSVAIGKFQFKKNIYHF